MVNPTLATQVDVEESLGRSLTAEEVAQIDHALTKASELFRARAGQLFTPGESRVRLKVNGGVVRLTQAPVVEVVSVSDDAGNPVAFETFGQLVKVPMMSHEFVRVEYRHGGDIPDLVRTTVAECVARAFQVDPMAKRGYTQRSKTTGPFTDSGTFATWAVGGQVMLSPDDVATAQTFRATRVGGVIVQGGR